jgi:hypothetical protein
MSHPYYKPGMPKETNEIFKSYQNGQLVDLEMIYFSGNAAGGIISTLGDMMKFSCRVLDNNPRIPMSSGLVYNLQ